MISRNAMDERPTQDLATRAFQKRVLDEFAAVRAEQAGMRAEQAEMRAEQAQMRAEQAQMRAEQTEMRKEIGEIRAQQSAMARNIAALDERLTAVEGRLRSLEEKVDSRLRETQPFWETLEEQLSKLNTKFDIAIHDFLQLRGEAAIHARLIYKLEE